MYTYIIVDDEMIIRRGCIAKISQAAALSVECAGEASNGFEALELVEKTKPDIVITDMKMAGMDGIEFLEKLSVSHPKIPVIVISGYRLFDYVKKAIEKHAIGYVLKPFSSEEIAEQIRKAIDQLESRNRVIQLQQEVAYFEQKKKQEAILNAIIHPWSEGTAVSLLANGYELGREYLFLTITTERQNVGPRLEELCGKLPALYCVVGNPQDKFQYLLLLHCAPGAVCLSAIAESLAEEISGLADGSHLIICVSRTIQKADGLNQLFLENNQLLRHVFLTERVCILRSKNQREEQPLLNEEEIQSLFLNMKYHTCKTLGLLEKFFKSIDLQKHTLGSIEAVCGRLLEKVNEYAAQNQVETRDLAKHFCRNYLFSNSIEKIQADFTEYIHSTMSTVHLKEKDQENLLRLVKDYIEKNYKKKLTLQVIASKFYISPACCSNLLKENLNMTFNDYLSHIRIQKAKQLLSETSLSVNKISDEVGYSNPKYFFKIFKIYSGFTPLEYRSKNNYDMYDSIRH